jgi:site-specific recombinase XerC
VPVDVKLYCARHTFGTDLMRVTKDPFLTMRLMGHTEVSMTDKYQHPDFDGIGDLMDARNALRRDLRHTVSPEPVN